MPQLDLNALAVAARRLSLLTELTLCVVTANSCLMLPQKRRKGGATREAFAVGIINATLAKHGFVCAEQSRPRFLCEIFVAYASRDPRALKRFWYDTT